MSMNGQMETKLGKVTIDPEVIALYAGSVAVECFGIVGMAAVNMKDGLVKLLKKVPRRYLPLPAPVITGISQEE